MKTQALFQGEHTTVTLYNCISVSYTATYEVVAREEGTEGLGCCLPPLLAHFPAHTSLPSSYQSSQPHRPCSSSSPSHVVFSCCPTLMRQWHPRVPAVVPRNTSGQSFVPGCHGLGYCINEAFASSSQTLWCITCADPHVLL